MENTEHVLKVRRVTEVRGHTMYGDWALPDYDYSYISMQELVPKLFPDKAPEKLTFSNICAKPGNFFGTNDFRGPRFDAADTKYPGTVIRNMPNPCGTEYRMIDGRRRMEKLRRQGLDEGLFLVFDYEEIRPFIYAFELIS